MHHTTPHPRGVILLEAIVAIGVLIVVVTAVLGLTLRSSGATRTATDQVVATYLAQDVAEWLVAKKRYNDKSLNYWHGIVGSGDLGVSTESPLNTGALGLCTALAGCNLYRNPSTGRYTHVSAGNVLTPFQRKVRVSSINLDSTTSGYEAMEYTITVSWHDGARPGSFVMRTTLYKH